MAEFVGTYVDDVVDTVVASVVSGQHALLLGAPGCGKTTIARSALQIMTGGNYNFMRVAMGTQPEKIEGAYNPAKLLEGELERVVEGTPYAPTNRAVLLDEMPRGSEVIYDLLIDTLDRFDIANPPPVIGTANFAPPGERAEALRSRVALWTWVNVADLDVGAVALANMNGTRPELAPSRLPTWEQVTEVRQMDPGQAAQRAVVELLEQVAEMARTQSRVITHRQVAQWAQIVYRVSALHHGTADFTTVPAPAAGILEFAYPNATRQEANDWREIVRSVVDVVETRVEAVMAAALRRFQEVAGITDSNERGDKVADLGGFMVERQMELRQLPGGLDDPRVSNAHNMLSEWFAMASRGERPTWQF